MMGYETYIGRSYVIEIEKSYFRNNYIYREQEVIVRSPITSQNREVQIFANFPFGAIDFHLSIDENPTILLSSRRGIDRLAMRIIQLEDVIDIEDYAYAYGVDIYP